MSPATFSRRKGEGGPGIRLLLVYGVYAKYGVLHMAHLRQGAPAGTGLFVSWVCMMTLCSSPGSGILISDSVGRSELESCKWRSSFPKYSLSLRVQITLLENPLIADNTKGDESRLYRFPTDQLCRLQGLSGLQSLTHCTEQQRSKAQQYPVKAQVAVRDIGSGNLSRSRILDGNYHQYWWQEELCFLACGELCNGGREVAMPDRG